MYMIQERGPRRRLPRERRYQYNISSFLRVLQTVIRVIVMSLRFFKSPFVSSDLSFLDPISTEVSIHEVELMSTTRKIVKRIDSLILIVIKQSQIEYQHNSIVYSILNRLEKRNVSRMCIINLYFSVMSFEILCLIHQKFY